MNSLTLAGVMFTGYIVAYHTYGKFLGKKIFRVDPDAVCPSQALRDDVDFVPTDKNVLFGHHYTSIAGLGPIVGPAIAIIWGWVPAVLWVFFGSIFIGAVHDFGSLICSLRSQGRSIGDLSADLINPRVRTLFLLIIFFALWIVIAVFALIIAILFTMYPEAVLPVWFQIPIALGLGYLVYKKGMGHVGLGIAAVILMYATIVLGSYFPLALPEAWNPTVVWIVLLLIYAYVASTLPVQTLLQPRDYINAHQLLVAMALLGLGVLVAHPDIVAPAFDFSPPGAPPIWPFLFVVIACGAISGFHSLVSSGTSSKQCDTEQSAVYIGYGGMLLEGVLATFVIIAVSAGIGMGLEVEGGALLEGAKAEGVRVLTGVDAFRYHYSSWQAASGLPAKLGAFVTGAANMIGTIGLPAKITVAIMGVFLVSFAATTLDTATRIQRYVVSELAGAWVKPLSGLPGGAFFLPLVKLLTRRHPATLLAVGTAFILAFSNGTGTGAMALWPLFGTVNQLLAGLALLVVTVYLARRGVNALYTAIPMVFMIAMTGWAMTVNLRTFYADAVSPAAENPASDWLLFAISLAVFVLEIWMIAESALVLKKVYGKNRQGLSALDETFAKKR